MTLHEGVVRLRRPVFLLDNSVGQRLGLPPVVEAFEQLCEEGTIATCLPALLEEGFSARSAADHGRVLQLAARGRMMLPPEPDVVPIALGIQSALFHRGKGRSVGVSDLEIAATAIHHSTDDHPVILVHYDSDFDHVAAVEPRLRSRWIVPRGTVA